MDDPLQHPTDALPDAVDGRLSAAERAALDAHLSACPSCRREFEGLSWVKRQTRDVVRADANVPSELDAALVRVLDAEDRRPGTWPASASGMGQAFPRRRWIGAVAAAAAVGVVAWIWPRVAPSHPAQVAADFRAFVSGDLSIDIRTPDPADLDARLRTEDFPFPVRVFDFGMMNFGLTGGGVHEVGGRRSALFAYAGRDALRVLCQMYAATIDELPPPLERRTNNGIEFLVYRDGDVTLVFWQEGSVLCVLAANGEPEAAIALAFAKAVRV